MRPFDLQPGVYAILDGKPFTELFELGSQLLKTPICALQIRAKSLDPKNHLTLIQNLFSLWHLLPATKPHLIINDDLKLAQELHLPLHWGQEDWEKNQWVNLHDLGIPVGISTHDFEQARRAQDWGAAYIGLGPMFKTHSKKNPLPPRNIQDLKKILSEINIPVIAIGGINANNYQSLIESGVKHLAMIQGLFEPGVFDLINQCARSEK